MSMKKSFLAISFALFIATMGYSQAVGLGIMGSYSQNNPSFWTIGSMIHVANDYSGNIAHFLRVGWTFGELTMTYDRKNPFTSKDELTEYWQKSYYMDWILGYVFQAGFGNIIALRLGADIYASFSNAYVLPNRDSQGSIGLSGIGGLALFPKNTVSLLFDVCPGFTLNPEGSGVAFILPLRVALGLNVGKDIGQRKYKLAN